MQIIDEEEGDDNPGNDLTISKNININFLRRYIMKIKLELQGHATPDDEDEGPITFEKIQEELFKENPGMTDQEFQSTIEFMR